MTAQNKLGGSIVSLALANAKGRTMHPVIDLLVSRAKSGSRPGRRGDGFKLGLAVEGGGMRGVVSSGMLTALESLRLVDVFDAVYGSSAGPLNAAYFLTGQMAYATTIYYEEINNDNFINLRRAFSSQPIMSLDFLIYHVMAKKKILNWQVLLNSPIPLVVVASSVSRVEAVGHRAFESHEQLLLALKAGATLPFIAGPPVHLEGDDFLDAMLCERIPYRTAIADGCTHILALLTRPPEQRPHVPSVLEKLLFGRYLKSLNPRLNDAFLKGPRQYAEDIARLVTETATPANSPYLYAVQVEAGAPTIARMEKDRRALVAGAIAGAKSVFRAILGLEAHFVEVLRPYDAKGLEIRPPWA